MERKLDAMLKLAIDIFHVQKEFKVRDLMYFLTIVDRMEVNQSELRHVAGELPSTIFKRIDRLAELGLVEKFEGINNENRGIIVLRPTKKGENLVRDYL